MKLELKNIKYFASGSQETYCYAATMYVDGKPFASVSNDGRGGMDDYRPFDYKAMSHEEFQKKENEIQAYLKANNEPTVYENFTVEYDIEAFCFDAVNDFILKKELRSQFGRNILFTKPDSDTIYSMSRTQKGKKFDAAIAGAQIIKRHGIGTKILNIMLFDDAFKFYKSKQL